MRINADFDRPALSRDSDRDWIPSPMAGVERQMLDRVGEEVARATSLVRYAPGTEFSSHTHDLGEEFLVLAGVFSDEHDDYPAGTYVRNPPGTAHSPRVDLGCTIFVKLRQFDAGDLVPVRIDTMDETQWADIGGGIKTLPLHGHGKEDVFVVGLEPDANLERPLPGGAELLVLSGSLVLLDMPGTTSDATLRARDWLRLPAGSNLTVIDGQQGGRFYLKTGHLG